MARRSCAVRDARTADILNDSLIEDNFFSAAALGLFLFAASFNAIYCMDIIHSLSLLLADRTAACSKVGCWHDTVVRLSVRLSVCDEVYCRPIANQYILQQKSEQVKRKCFPGKQRYNVQPLHRFYPSNSSPLEPSKVPL